MLFVWNSLLMVIVTNTMYHNDTILENETDKLINENNSKYRCKNDHDYSYLSMGQINSTIKGIIVCNIHARQFITAQICLNFMKKISYENLLENVHLLVFYRGNKRRDQSLKGEYCIRKNRNQIDLNRNFPTGFNSNNYSNSNQQYSGFQPLSENFSRCIDEIVSQFQLNFFIDLHSGEFTFYHDISASQQEISILQELQSNYCRTCRVVALKQYNGQMFTDMKIRYHIPYSFLFQVYGGYNANYNSNELCFTIFNPRNSYELQFYIKKWVKILINTIQNIELKYKI